MECRLRGGSMEPAIPRGSKLRIDLGSPAPGRVGEVIAFVQDSGICVHRVAYLGRGRRSREYLVTQGDACFHPDAPLHARCVLGPVTEFLHDGHWTAVSNRPSSGRSLPGRLLLKFIAGFMEIDVRLAGCAAAVLRIRKESAVTVET